MKLGKRRGQPTRRNLRRRNEQVRALVSLIDHFTDELTKAHNAEREIEIRAELKRLRKIQRGFSLYNEEPKSSVSLPKSYVEARTERIETAKRISKRGYIRLVQGGAPGNGRKR
jgi:hypothetical protein